MPGTTTHPSGELVEVRRSARRTRTVTARREGDRVVVLVPARTSRADEAHWVDTMLARLHRSEQRRRSAAARSDDELVSRATALARRHLDAPAGRAVRPASVRWVAPMRSRWASCTPADASIRVSETLRTAPGWVLDYVLVHELAHLVEPGHTDRFWALVSHYPRTERAVGYLEGLSAAASWGVQTPAPEDEGPAGP
ncbi:M48 family metallopeptidase [Rhodococcus aerolatus]